MSGLIIELLIKVDISAPSGKIEIDTTTISGQMMVISSVWGEYFPDTYIEEVKLLSELAAMQMQNSKQQYSRFDLFGRSHF